METVGLSAFGRTVEISSQSLTFGQRVALTLCLPSLVPNSRLVPGRSFALAPGRWRRAVNSPNGTRNRLLAMMSPADRDRLAASIEMVELDARQILEEPGEVISHVYFVESGLVSIVGTAPQGHRIEIGMVGYEGMTGIGIVLGDDRSPNEALVQSAGAAMRISAPRVREAIADSPTLARHSPSLCPRFHDPKRPNGARQRARQAR